MFMRFRGGGVGHYRLPLPPDNLDDHASLRPDTVEELSSLTAAEVDDDVHQESGDDPDEDFDMEFDDL